MARARCSGAMRAAWVFVVGCVAVAPAARADQGRSHRPAEDDAASGLVWRAPAGCPDLASLHARIERRLQRPLGQTATPIRIEVTRRGGRYRAQVDLQALTVAPDVRTLASARCSDLADAVAVIVARVTMEAHTPPEATRPDVVTPHAAAAARSPEPPAQHVDVPDRRSPPPVAIAEPTGDDAGRGDATRPGVTARYSRAASPSPARRWTLGARLSGVSGIGVLPRVGLGGELALTARYQRSLAELATARWFESVAQLYNGRPTKVDIDLDVVITRYGWRPDDLPLRAWVGLEVGTMRGNASQPPSQQLPDGRWLAAGAGFAVAWQMTPWIRLLGATEAMVAIERVRFSLMDGLVAYAPAPMSARFTFGFEVGWQ